jgi:hypothetical protein
LRVAVIERLVFAVLSVAIVAVVAVAIAAIATATVAVGSAITFGRIVRLALGVLAGAAAVAAAIAFRNIGLALAAIRFARGAVLPAGRLRRAITTRARILVRVLVGTLARILVAVLIAALVRVLVGALVGVLIGVLIAVLRTGLAGAALSNRRRAALARAAGGVRSLRHSPRCRAASSGGIAREVGERAGDGSLRQEAGRGENDREGQR